MTRTSLQPGDEPRPGASVHLLPVFPLPNAVFFPNTLLPLHVFEPRYRELIKHVMETDQRMAIALLRPGFEPAYHGAPAIHDVVCLGEVVTMQNLPDGRSNVLLRGLARVLVTEELETEHPFRMVDGTIQGDELDGRQGDTLARELATVRQLFSTVVARVPQLQIQDAGALFSPDADPGSVLDAIASAVPADSERKQEVLSASNLVQRAEVLTSVLAEAVADTMSQAYGNV